MAASILTCGDLAAALEAITAGEAYQELLVRWERRRGAVGRYYLCHVHRDLFGTWTLTTVWGSVRLPNGATRPRPLSDLAEAKSALHAIAKRRRQHGYGLVQFRCR